jgi:hypothetical protein
MLALTLSTGSVGRCFTTLHQRERENNVNVVIKHPLMKKKTKFPPYIYKGIQMGSGAKSYMRKGFLIYQEIRK